MPGLGLDQLPSFRVRLHVETRKNDRAPRQHRDYLQKRGGGRNAAGRSGGDHRRRRRGLRPGLRLCGKQPAASVRRVDAALFSKDRRPLLGDDLQELECDLPVAGELLGDDAGEISPVTALDKDLIDEPTQLRGEPCRLVR